jgi:hypothetical protein
MPYNGGRLGPVFSVLRLRQKKMELSVLLGNVLFVRSL